MPRARKKNSNAATCRVKLIAGQWRGRNLSFPDAVGLRPTGNRIRETLFNWLMPLLPGSRCLDAFAGSGALGFEALSRGARVCVMAEVNTEALKALRLNAQTLNATGATIVADSALNVLAHEREAFDGVFIDPPFAEALWEPVFEALEGRLSPDAWVYVEAPKDRALAVPSGWQLHRTKTSGEVTFALYRVP